MKFLALSVLLAAGSHFALADDLGDELLAAARKSDAAKVKALLDQGANVNAKTRYNQTPLFFACDRGSLEVAKLLVDHGADLNVKDNFYSATPLTWALSKKNMPIIELLIEKGVDPADALAESIESNNQPLFKVILDKGKTNPAMLGEALQFASAQKHPDMVEALKAKGAKPYQVETAKLADYTGAFTDGANMNFNFIVKDDALTISQPGFSAALIPTDKDTFKLISQGMVLTFTRENGQVTGFEMPTRGGVTRLKKKETPK